VSSTAGGVTGGWLRAAGSACEAQVNLDEAATPIARKRYRMPEAWAVTTRKGRSARSLASPIGFNRMCQKNAGAKEPNKQHRRRPLILTARWWDDGKRLSVSGRFRRF
jgi:hypothetical protein